MQVTIRQGDGPPQVVDIDLSMRDMDIQEAARLEEQLGPDRFEQVLDHPDDIRSPIVLRAVIWTKVATHIPGIGIDEFTLDLGAMEKLMAQAAPEGPPPGMVIPMETHDGDVSEAVVGADPLGQASAGG